MAGFDGNDRQKEAVLGYRASVLQPEIASYNGFQFPPALESKITVVPEYDDSGRTTKYLTIALSVSFIVTDTTLYSYQTDRTLNRDSKNAGMELMTKSLITRLCQPCQPLYFSARGYGNFSVNTPGGIEDVDFGPKPQVVEIEPLGGSQAYRVEWLCVTRVPPCLRDKSGKLIQFNYTTNWNMDTAGFMTRTIDGSAEVPKTRDPYVGSVHASDQVKFPSEEYKLIKEKIWKAFPMSPGFRRSVSYGWSNNRKTLSFKIEDIEIRSDSPFLPGISDIELTQNMTSSLEDGFRNWKVTYAANIEVVNSKTLGGVSEAKKIAWVWIGKFLQEKRKLFAKVVTDVSFRNNTRPIPVTDGIDITDPVNLAAPGMNTLVQLYALQKGASMSDNGEGAFILPLQISITDSIYSNSISVSVTYKAIVTSDLIGQAVGLFEKVKIPGLNSDTWVKFYESAKVFDTSLSTGEKTELIVDLCHPVSAPRGTEPTTNVTEKYKPERILAITVPGEGRDWEYYKNVFVYLDSQQNVVSSRLHAETGATTDLFPEIEQKNGDIEQANAPFETRELLEAFVNANGEARKQVKVYSSTPPICYVMMIGYACRYNGRINPPSLIGVGEGITIDPQTGKGIITNANTGLGGSLAHKFGDGMLKRTMEKTGLTDDSGRPVVRHKAAWKQMYVLDRAPKSGQITTTGIPHRFEVNYDS